MSEEVRPCLLRLVRAKRKGGRTLSFKACLSSSWRAQSSEGRGAGSEFKRARIEVGSVRETSSISIGEEVVL